MYRRVEASILERHHIFIAISLIVKDAPGIIVKGEKKIGEILSQVNPEYKVQEMISMTNIK